MTAGEFWAIYDVVFQVEERKEMIEGVLDMVKKVEGLAKHGNRT